MSYIVYINTPENVSEIALPQINDRTLKLDFSRIYKGLELSMTVFDNVWKIIRGENYSLLENGIKIPEAEMSDGTVVNIEIDDPDKGMIVIALMTKQMQAENNVYRKYLLDKDEVTVGNGYYDICIADEYMSGSGQAHCTIRRDYGGAYIEDSSRNGTYVNGLRIAKERLDIFDTIYCAGHKLIYLGNMIAVNENDKSITTSLPPAEKNYRIPDDISDEPFSRSPRRSEPLKTDTVQIESPPQKQQLNSQPLLFVVGPSVTMPIPIMLSVMFNMYMRGQNTDPKMYIGTLISVGASALIGTGWAIAHMVYNKKRYKKQEKERTENYEKYIGETVKQLENKTEESRKILESNYPSSADLIYHTDTDIIWNRNMYQKDFLTVRIGIGTREIPGGINIGQVKHSAAVNDELVKKPEELYDKYSYMDDCTATLSLIEHKIIGVVGEDNSQLINNLVVQLTALHSYTDLILCVLADTSDFSDYSWMHWLPHIRSEQEKRLIGFDESGRENAAFAISGILSARIEKGVKGIALPHIVVISSSPEHIIQTRLSGYMNLPEYMGITFILLADTISKLPNVCKAIIENDDKYTGFYMLDGEMDDKGTVRFDLVTNAEAESYARNISGLYLGNTVTGSIPDSIGYFDMLRIGRPEHWDLVRRYKENRSYEGLKSLLGVGSSGQPLYLDIHDKKHGPHGLVAGTTGSGKSETIQTFILSLAMNYSPDEVSFILIDYKGGGMANVFDGLPHIAGMLTNLSSSGSDGESGIDPEIAKRVCDTMRSEIKRRQRIFGQYDINHIDSYSRLYREGETNEPLPHLVIISDEFAELKKEQPEFIRELVSVARVGRSLGIHLILATQKPAGVVDDEIWSNSRFRLCLRVQDKQDSMGMLKTPDAAYITEAGRGYIQVGTDEVYEMFQSAYSGGEYIPKDKPVPEEDSIVKMIGIDGSDSVVKRKKVEGTKETELHALVKYIAKVCSENNIHSAIPLWLPPLSDKLYVQDIEKVPSAGYTAVYGLADDFEKQQQYALKTDISQCRNLKIVGMPGSGKTTLIQTMVMSLVRKCSPMELNFYFMDFSSRTFKIFSKLPHCGGAVFEEDREGVEKTVEMMLRMIRERKTKFESAGSGSYAEYKRRNPDLPLVLLIIDNASPFGNDGAYSSLSEKLIDILKEGNRYGIQTVMSMSSLREISYRMRGYVYDSIALQLADRSDYSEVLKITPQKLCRSIPGRGLYAAESGIVEFQTLLPAYGDTESDRTDCITAEIEEYPKTDVSARRLPVIPKGLRYADISAKASADIIPIGLDYDTAEPFGFSADKFYCCCISGAGRAASNLLSCIAYLASERKYKLDIVKLRNSVKIDIPECAVLHNTAESVHELIKTLHQEFTERNNEVGIWKKSDQSITRQKYLEKVCGEHFIIIDDMKEFCTLLDEHPHDKQDQSLFTFFVQKGAEHAVHFFAAYDPSMQTYSAAAKIFRSENCGIHIGANGTVQNVLDFGLPGAVLASLSGNNMGYAVENDRTAKVYVPQYDIRDGEI